MNQKTMRTRVLATVYVAYVAVGPMWLFAATQDDRLIAFGTRIRHRSE